MGKLHYNFIEEVDGCYQLVTYFDESGFADVEDVDRQIDEILMSVGTEDAKTLGDLNKARIKMLAKRKVKIPTVMLRDFVYPRPVK